MKELTGCYTCLFTGQYNSKGYDTITDCSELCANIDHRRWSKKMSSLEGPTFKKNSCWLDQDIAPPTFFSLASWFWRQPKMISQFCQIVKDCY